MPTTFVNEGEAFIHVTELNQTTFFLCQNGILEVTHSLASSYVNVEGVCRFLENKAE